MGKTTKAKRNLVQASGDVVEASRDVVKASPAIHIQNNITLLQRRAWNVLLYNAYDNLMDVPIHEITIKKLCDILDFSSNNQKYLKEALRAMASCVLEWNLLQKDTDGDWGVATLLADARIRNGVCTYSYGAQFREVLYNPKMYARINLSLQNRFDSKHAHALWELCLDYLGASREYGETPYIEVSLLKKLMGIGENAYPSYKRLSEKVIKPAVAEINKISDMQVTVDSQRRGRKVTALKFKVRRVAILPGANGKQSSLFPDLEDMPVVVKVLEEAGLPAHGAWEIFQSGFNYVDADKRPVDLGDDPMQAFAYYVREKVNLLQRGQKQGKIKNATGFLREAIKQNYANPEFAEAQMSDAAHNDEIKKNIKKKKLQEQQHYLEERHGQALSDLCQQIAHDDPSLLERITQEILEVPFNRSQYDAKKSPIENYLNTQGLRSLINERIMEDCAEQFDMIGEEYEKQIMALKQQIEATESLL